MLEAFEVFRADGSASRYEDDLIGLMQRHGAAAGVLVLCGGKAQPGAATAWADTLEDRDVAAVVACLRKMADDVERRVLETVRGRPRA